MSKQTESVRGCETGREEGWEEAKGEMVRGLGGSEEGAERRGGGALRELREQRRQPVIRLAHPEPTPRPLPPQHQQHRHRLELDMRRGLRHPRHQPCHHALQQRRAVLLLGVAVRAGEECLQVLGVARRLRVLVAQNAVAQRRSPSNRAQKAQRERTQEAGRTEQAEGTEEKGPAERSKGRERPPR